MTLSNADLGLCLESNENEVCVWIIEEPTVLRDVLEVFLAQHAGQKGAFNAFKGEKNLSWTSQVSLILNPLLIDLNDRKIHSKLYQDIETHVKESLVEETQSLTTEVVNYLDKALFHVPYHVSYDLDLNVNGLLKLFNVGIEEQGIDLLERMISYVRVLSSLCHVEIFIFYNLKDFFTENELKQFYEFAFYSKISIVLIERTQRYTLSCERTTVLDKDKCMIQF